MILKMKNNQRNVFYKLPMWSRMTVQGQMSWPCSLGIPKTFACGLCGGPKNDDLCLLREHCQNTPGKGFYERILRHHDSYLAEYFHQSRKVSSQHVIDWISHFEFSVSSFEKAKSLKGAQFFIINNIKDHVNMNKFQPQLCLPRLRGPGDCKQSTAILTGIQSGKTNMHCIFYVSVAFFFPMNFQRTRVYFLPLAPEADFGRRQYNSSNIFAIYSGEVHQILTIADICGINQ